MMCSIDFELSSESNFPERERIDLVDFWQSLMKNDDSGSAAWEDLEYLYERVSRCLSESPPDIGLAECLTSQAMRCIIGQEKV